MTKRSANTRWLNRTVLAIGLASLFSDVGHEMATSAMPALLASFGASSAVLGLIEGLADGVSSFAKFFSGLYSDRKRRGGSESDGPCSTRRWRSTGSPRRRRLRRRASAGRQRGRRGRNAPLACAGERRRSRPFPGSTARCLRRGSSVAETGLRFAHHAPILIRAGRRRGGGPLRQRHGPSPLRSAITRVLDVSGRRRRTREDGPLR